MALDPSPQGRPVLEEEKEAEEEEGQRERERREAADAGNEAVYERGDALRNALLRRRVGALGARGVDPGVLEPALHLVGGVGCPGRDLVGLGDDPADDEDANRDSDNEEQQRAIPDPPARPIRWCASQRTSGSVTHATTKAAITGWLISEVAPSSQITPTSRKIAPTRSHDATPRSRSQRGAEKTAESCPS